MKNKVFMLLGWFGAGLVLMAFGLMSFGVITNKGGVYHLLNMLGATGIVIDAVHEKDWPPAVLNMVWFFIALVSPVF